jgi:hypothetical protein
MFIKIKNTVIFVDHVFYCFYVRIIRIGKTSEIKCLARGFTNIYL